MARNEHPHICKYYMHDNLARMLIIMYFITHTWVYHFIYLYLLFILYTILYIIIFIVRDRGHFIHLCSCCCSTRCKPGILGHRVTITNPAQVAATILNKMTKRNWGGAQRIVANCGSYHRHDMRSADAAQSKQSKWWHGEALTFSNECY